MSSSVIGGRSPGARAVFDSNREARSMTSASGSVEVCLDDDAARPIAIAIGRSWVSVRIASAQRAAWAA